MHMPLRLSNPFKRAKTPEFEISCDGEALAYGSKKYCFIGFIQNEKEFFLSGKYGHSYAVRKLGKVADEKKMIVWAIENSNDEFLLIKVKNKNKTYEIFKRIY